MKYPDLPLHFDHEVEIQNKGTIKNEAGKPPPPDKNKESRNIP